MRIFIEPTFSRYYAQHPLVLVDIGASGGLEQNWKSAKKYLHIIGFEPYNKAFSDLQRDGSNGVKYLNVGLHNEKASLKFYSTRKQTTSSIFKPNREFLDKFPEEERFDILDEVKIECDTLDNQLLSNNISEVDFIKIDTQGSELFILQGAEKTIEESVFGLEIEVEFVEIYQNQPLFADVDSFIRRQDFQLFDIKRNYWKRSIGQNYHKKGGQLIFGDALYLRSAESFKEIIDRIQGREKKKGKILKALSICFLYGYLDYAKEILNMVSDLFEKKEHQVIENVFKSSIRLGNKVPSFRGRRKISGMIHSFWDVMRPTHGGWAISDRKLGNL